MIEYIGILSGLDLSGLVAGIYSELDQIHSDVERKQFCTLAIARAEEISPEAVSSVKSIIKAFEKEKKKKEKELKRINAFIDAQDSEDGYVQLLKRDDKGNVTPTVENFLTIMNFDSYYSSIRFNLIKNSAEKHSVNLGVVSIEPWDDSDDAASATYIESKFKIYNDQKHAKALTQFFKNREYNPVRDIVDNIEWDGKERIHDFLHRWMKCDDNPYTREVSRLIFAGGINRLYLPGCKFDDVPVLIGSKQGEGKSTLIKWLAINDQFETDVTQFEGQQGIEQLEGAWICEIAELLALTKLKEQEAAKAFITRSTDKYRKPWGKNTSEYPRRCIFIGTTNNRRFLKDKTGNRRFYPVEVHSSGYDLFDHEQECRDYILQCWAEAREKLKAGNMPAYANKALTEAYKEAQSDAMEDDWREGAIINYLKDKYVGDRVCARQIAREALVLNSDDFPKDPTKKESQEIGEIMDRMPGWERVKSSFRCGVYGTQKGWEKIDYGDDEPPEALPF